MAVAKHHRGHRARNGVVRSTQSTFALADGRKLTLKWQEPMLLATFPNGAQTQIFLASPTEESVRNPAAGGLRFTLDEQALPQSVALVRAGREIWRAKRVN